MADRPKNRRQLEAFGECLASLRQKELTEDDVDVCCDMLEDAGVDLDLIDASESGQYVIEVRRKADGG